MIWANPLNLTDKAAQQRGDEFIASEIVPLALADDKGEARPPVEGARPTRASPGAGHRRCAWRLQNVGSADAEPASEALKKYCVDLTDRACQGKLDPVTGRDDEIRRAIQIPPASHQEQPAAALIGEPMWARRQYRRGPAQRIINGEARDPEGARWCRDMAGLLAGAKVPRRVRGGLKAVPERRC